MEIYEFLITGLIVFLSTFMAVIIGLRYSVEQLKNSYYIEELFENMLKSATSDEETQKMLYQLGGIIGNGIKGGIGVDLPKQRSGKFKWSDILLDLAAQFLSTPPSPSPQTPQPLPPVKSEEYIKIPS